MKLDNKGFAITTILYGTLILFILLLLSLLGILSQYKNNLDKLINEGSGARSIVTMEKIEINEGEIITNGGLYLVKMNNGTNCTKYFRINSTATCNED